MPVFMGGTSLAVLVEIDLDIVHSSQRDGKRFANRCLQLTEYDELPTWQERKGGTELRILPILLLFPYLTGCLGLGYPSISQTPAIAVTEPDVRAFRVTDDARFIGLMGIPLGSSSVVEIEPDDSIIASHVDAYFKYYFIAFPFGIYNTHCDSIRLYRRGYETVTVESKPVLSAMWNNTPPLIAWKKADTLQARAKAIDDVLLPISWMLVTCTKQNSFLAAEYQSLAESDLAAGPENAEARQQLLERAANFTAGKVGEPRLAGYTLSPLSP